MRTAGETAWDVIRDAKGDNIGSTKEIRGNESGVPAEMEFRIFRFRSRICALARVNLIMDIMVC